MTPHQQGRAAHLAGTCRFSNPHPFASAAFASWACGWVASVTEAVRGRTPRKAA